MDTELLDELLGILGMELTLEPLELRDLDDDARRVRGLSLPFARAAAAAAARNAVLLVGEGLERFGVVHRE